MRRIIERKVTIVTTTTWTISWQDASPPSQPAAAPAPEIIANADASSAAQTAPDPSTVIDVKEAESESAEQSTQSNSPSRIIVSYPSKPERK